MTSKSNKKLDKEYPMRTYVGTVLIILGIVTILGVLVYLLFGWGIIQGLIGGSIIAVIIGITILAIVAPLALIPMAIDITVLTFNPEGYYDHTE